MFMFIYIRYVSLNWPARYHHLVVDEDGEGDISRQVAEKLKEMKTGAAKKRVLRPQPKLDPIR